MLEEKIADYNENVDEIVKWTNLKGKKKYLEFVKLLENKNKTITWRVLDDLFRYDKRLLFNLFKYISMFEDYIRALILNLTKIEFEVIKEDYFKKEMKFIVENDERYKFNNYIDIDLLRNCYEDINEIRKNICHNKIMLNIENLNKKIEEFMNVLPEDYREGFRNIINDSKNKLVLDSSFIIKL